MTQDEIYAEIEANSYGGSKANKLAARTKEKQMKLSGMTADDADSGEGWRLEGGDSPEVFHDITPTGDANNERSKVYKQVAYANDIPLDEAIAQVDGAAEAYKADLEYRKSKDFLQASLDNPNDPYYRSKDMTNAVVANEDDGEFSSFDVYKAGDQATEAAKVDAVEHPDANLYNSEKFLTGEYGHFGRALSDNKEYVNRQIANGYMVPGSNDPEEYKKQMALYENAKAKGLGNFSNPRDARTMDIIYNTGYSKAQADIAAELNTPYEDTDYSDNSYVGNMLKAGVAGFAGGWYGDADAIGEIAHIGDLGTDDERTKQVNNFFGYDDTRSAKSMAIISKAAKKMWDKGELDSDGLMTIAKAAFTDADSFMYSLGTLASWMIGGEIGAPAKAAKALKAAKVARAAGDTAEAAKMIQKARVLQAEVKGMSAATKTAAVVGNVITKDAGFNAAVMSATNDDIDAFKENNGGEYSVEDVARIALVNYAGMALDKGVDLHLLKSTPGAMDSLVQAAKYMGADGRKVIQSKIAALTKSGSKGMAKLAVSMGEEGAQEYVQTMAEIFNEQYGTEKYGDDAGKILTNDDNIVQGLTGAAAGAGMGAQFHAIGTANSIVKAAKNNIGSGFDPERYSGFTSKVVDAHRKASLEDLAKVKSPEARKFNTDIINDDVVKAVNDLDSVPEGKSFADHVADVVANATERTAAVNDVKSDEAKGIIASNLVNRIMEQGKNIDDVKRAEVVNAATKGLSEKAKKVVYDRIISKELQNVDRQFMNDNAKVDAVNVTGGAMDKLNAEKLAAIKAKAKDLSEMGSTFNDGGYIKNVADDLVKQATRYTAPGKNMAQVNKEIFETGFTISGKFGDTYNKSMKEHANDISEDMQKTGADDSTAIKSLQKFVDTRRAAKIGDSNPVTGVKYSKNQQATFARSVYENNEKIGKIIDDIIRVAKTDGRADYVTKLEGMKAELDGHNSDLVEKFGLSSVGSSKSDNGNVAANKWVDSITDGLSTDSDEVLAKKLSDIDNADTAGYSKRHLKLLDTARQYIISKIGSGKVVDEPIVDTGSNEGVIYDADGNLITVDEPIVNESVSSEPEANSGKSFDIAEYEANNDASIDKIESIVKASDDIKVLKAMAKGTANLQNRDDLTEAQLNRLADIGVLANEKVIALSKPAKKAEKNVPANMITAINSNVVDVADSKEVTDLRKQYDEVDRAINGIRVKTEDDFNEYKSMVKERKELGAKIVEAMDMLRQKAINDEVARVNANNKRVNETTSKGFTEDNRKTLKASILTARIAAKSRKADDVVKLKVQSDNTALEARLIRENMKSKPRADVVEKLTEAIKKNNSKVGQRLNERRARNKTIDGSTKNAEEIGARVSISEKEREELKAVAEAEDAIRESMEDVERLIDEAYKGKELERRKMRKSFKAKTDAIWNDLKDAKKARRQAIRLARKAKDRGKVMAVLSSPKALTAVLIASMKELHAEVKMLKAKLGARYELVRANLEALDLAMDSRIKNLKKRLSELGEQKREANAARREVVRKVLKKHTGFAEIESMMKGNSIFEETVQASGATDTNIFNRELTPNAILGNIVNVLNLGLLPTSMHRKIMAELDGVKSDGNSMLDKVRGDIAFAKEWITKGGAATIRQDMIIKLSKEPELTPADRKAVEDGKLEVLVDDNGVKRIALMNDGEEVVLPDGAEYAINPMMMVLDYKDGDSVSGKGVSKKLKEAIALEGMQLISDMVNVKYKAGSEMEQFVKGVFGADKGSSNYEALVGVIKSGNIPEAAFIQSAGRNVMKLMGIKADKDLNVDQANALVSALGQMVVEQVKGIQGIDGFDANQNYYLAVNNVEGGIAIKGVKGANGVLPVVDKTTYDAVKGDSGREFRLLSFDMTKDAEKKLLSAAGTMEYLGADGHRRGASLDPLSKHKVGDKLIRGTSTLADEKDVDYLNKQEAIPRTFNETFKVLENVLGDKAEDWYDALLQPYDDIAKLPAKEREVALVNRKAGEFEIDGILETRAYVGDEDWYLPWDMTSSDRYMIDSNVINPQNGKISRFLVGMQGMRSTMKWGKDGFNAEDLNLFHAAASQALGYGIDKNPDENVIAELNNNHFELMSDGTVKYSDSEKGRELKGWVQAVKDGKVPDMRHEDPKERMHAFQVVVALSKVEGGKDFEHEVVIEMDGVTNGMIMTLLQIGTDEAMALLKKGGVYYHKQFDGKDISDEEFENIVNDVPAGLKKKLMEAIDKIEECKGQL